MTQTLTNTSKAQYLADLEALPAEGVAPCVASVRAMGAEQVREMDFPHRRMEEWRHTDVSAIAETPYRTVIAEGAAPAVDVSAWRYGEPGWTELVFVDGRYCPSLSTVGALPDSAYAGGLAAALEGPHSETVAAHLNSCLGRRSIFTALNSAFLSDGAFIHVPRNTVLEAPIHVVFVSTAGEYPAAIHPRNLVVLEEGAEASVVCTYAGVKGEGGMPGQCGGGSGVGAECPAALLQGGAGRPRPSSSLDHGGAAGAGQPSRCLCNHVIRGNRPESGDRAIGRRGASIAGCMGCI